MDFSENTLALKSEFRIAKFVCKQLFDMKTSFSQNTSRSVVLDAFHSTFLSNFPVGLKFSRKLLLSTMKYFLMNADSCVMFLLFYFFISGSFDFFYCPCVLASFTCSQIVPRNLRGKYALQALNTFFSRVLNVNWTKYLTNPTNLSEIWLLLPEKENGNAAVFVTFFVHLWKRKNINLSGWLPWNPENSWKTLSGDELWKSWSEKRQFVGLSVVAPQHLWHNWISLKKGNCIRWGKTKWGPEPRKISMLCKWVSFKPQIFVALRILWAQGLECQM